MAKERPVRDYVKEAGAAAIGARLRRLSAALDADARRLYVGYGVDFEQRWLGLIDLLSTDAPLTVGEIATALGITHVSVSQARQSLARHGLIQWTTDEGDRRRRQLSLTAKGEALAEKLRPLWAALDEAAIELDREAGNAVEALEALERAYRTSPLRERVSRILARGEGAGTRAWPG